MKDPVGTRGLRICTSGAIAQIRSDDGETFQGVIADQEYGYVRFLSFGTTGSLVETSWGRFCGAAVGRNSYQSLDGATQEVVLLVGMFDLPANRRIRAKRTAGVQ